MCEQFRFRREISGDNPGPGWLSSTGNLELGDSCGPGVELLLPATAPTGRAPRARPGLVGKDLKVPYTHTHTHRRPRSPELLFLWAGVVFMNSAGNLRLGCGWREEPSL